MRGGRHPSFTLFGRLDGCYSSWCISSIDYLWNRFNYFYRSIFKFPFFVCALNISSSVVYRMLDRICSHITTVLIVDTRLWNSKCVFLFRYFSGNVGISDGNSPTFKAFVDFASGFDDVSGLKFYSSKANIL